MVKQVILTREGKIQKVELRTPFSYLHELATNAASVSQRAKNGSGGGTTKTSRGKTADSLSIPLVVFL
jgi:hypothetical protein